MYTVSAAQYAAYGERLKHATLVKTEGGGESKILAMDSIDLTDEPLAHEPLSEKDRMIMKSMKG